jgi:hypothetical protein
MTASTITKKRQPIAMVCIFCGSQDVRVDAWAEWDVRNQRWKLAETFDAAFCNSCEGEAKYAHSHPLGR